MIRFLSLALAICLVPATSSQALAGEHHLRRHVLLWSSTVGSGTPFVGFSYRLRIPERMDIGVRPFFSIRPGDRRALERRRQHFYIQWTETYRIVTGMTADGVWMFSPHFGLHAGGGASYSFGDYSGSSTDPESGSSWIANVGGTLRIPGKREFVARVGYEYTERHTSPNGTMRISAGIGL